MKKLGSLFEEVLYDRKTEVLESNKENFLNAYYKTDIRITRGREAEGEERDETTATSYTHSSRGEVQVPEDRVENIQNLSNLVDYMASLVVNGKPLINDVVSEIIKTAAEAGTDSMEGLVQEEDKIIVDIDYGFDDRDSIGVKINKTAGSDLVSFSMKKNGNILPGNYNDKMFEQQILSIRERYMNKE